VFSWQVAAGNLTSKVNLFFVPYLFIEISSDFENPLSLVEVALFQFNFFPPTRATSEFSVSSFGPMISPDEETARIYQVISTSGMMNFGALHPAVSMQNCPWSGLSFIKKIVFKGICEGTTLSSCSAAGRRS
jgi:hypothetical protein